MVTSKVWGRGGLHACLRPQQGGSRKMRSPHVLTPCTSQYRMPFLLGVIRGSSNMCHTALQRSTAAQSLGRTGAQFIKQTMCKLVVQT